MIIKKVRQWQLRAAENLLAQIEFNWEFKWEHTAKREKWYWTKKRHLENIIRDKRSQLGLPSLSPSSGADPQDY